MPPQTNTQFAMSSPQTKDCINVSSKLPKICNVLFLSSKKTKITFEIFDKTQNTPINSKKKRKKRKKTKNLKLKTKHLKKKEEEEVAEPPRKAIDAILSLGGTLQIEC